MGDNLSISFLALASFPEPDPADKESSQSSRILLASYVM